jgi:hypothetical protein
MAYTIRQNGSQLQVYNALTGAPVFTISTGSDMVNWQISGETCTVYYRNGSTQVWSLSNRNRIR